MSAGRGSLTLVTRRSARRTVLERIHYDGISRCSRSFADDDAARIVVSQLGPGVVRGDRTILTGRLRAGSHLIVTQQTTTRILGGPAPSTARAHWTLDAGATLQLIGEPLIASADADYAATTEIDLGDGARVVMSEIAHVPHSARVRLHTIIRSGKREVLYDAVEAAAAAPCVVGTFAVIGLSPPELSAALDALDAHSDARTDVATGVGALSQGVFARVLGTDVWAVRSMLLTCVTLADRLLRPLPAAAPALGLPPDFNTESPCGRVAES